MSQLAIADALEHSQIKHAYDEYCKQILGNKQVLSCILKECVSEFHAIPLDQIPLYIEHEPRLNVAMEEDRIQGMNVEDTSVYGAMIRYDILFHAKLPNSKETETIGLIINIEAQNHMPSAYPLLSRAIYYGSRLLARQKNRKEGFAHSEFKQLKKVYSIWIVMHSPQAMAGVMNHYTIKEECIHKAYHFPIEDYDKLSVVMIYPSQIADGDAGIKRLMNLLYLLFKARKPYADKAYELREKYGIMMTREMEREVEEMCNLSQGVWNEGHAEGRMEGIAEGLAKGQIQGRIEGLSEGQAQGRIEMASELVLNMMKTTKQTIQEVMNLLGIEEALRPFIEQRIQTQTNHN